MAILYKTRRISNKNLISNHFKETGQNLGNYSSTNGNFFLLGDLNLELTELEVRGFCEIYSCKNLIKDNTCFKNPLKPSCIDLIIRDRLKNFQNSVAVETGLSDFHKIMLSVTKAIYTKQNSNIVTFGIINTFLMKRLCLTLKIVLFK